MTTIDLSFKKLDAIPEEVFESKGLKRLLLRGNQINEIPDRISDLIHLEDLDLSFNKIDILNNSLFSLRKLKILDLDNNNISEIDHRFRQMVALEALFVSNNKIKHIDEDIFSSIALKNLWIKNNKITNIQKLDKFISLKSLELRGNNIESIPQNILNEGSSTILEFLKQKKDEGIENLYEAKLIIIGESGAGKTTLANKIVNTDYKLIDEPSTHGIDVYSINVPCYIKENKVDFKLNIWDFGGQEIYHSTHQFFLTNRSLYVLVSDSRKEDTDFYYWLNTVSLLSDNSPVIIVMNEKHNRRLKLNELKLKSSFGNLLSIEATNLLTLDGFDNVKQSITNNVTMLPHIGDEIPATWVEIRRRLEQDPRNYISNTEFKQICNLCGVTKRDRLKSVSNYFHDLGIFLHFSQNKLLKKTIFLKPQWVTKSVYQILDSTELIDNYGKITIENIEKLLATDERIDVMDELIELMKKFDLCYFLDRSSNYIFPHLLSPNEPEYRWESQLNLVLHYRYKFLPKGLIHRLIVRLSTYISDHNLVWKEGVVIEKDDTFCEIIEDYVGRTISLRIFGEQKRNLLIIVTEEIDKLNNEFGDRIIANKYIPCICKECVALENPFHFSYESLQRRLRKGKTDVECDISYINIPVKQLIDDYLTSNEKLILAKNLISESRFMECLNHLSKMYPKDDKLPLIKGRFNRIRENIITGISTDDTISIEKSKIAKSLMSFIEGKN